MARLLNLFHRNQHFNNLNGADISQALLKQYVVLFPKKKSSPVSETGPRVCAVFEVGVDVLVTKDGEIEDAQAGAKEPGRRHHHQ